MATFGHLIKNYVIIEPFKLLSQTKEPLPAFAEKVGKWEFDVGVFLLAMTTVATGRSLRIRSMLRGVDGKDKTAFCEIFIGAEEFAKEKNFYWLYTLEDRGDGNSAGSNNPSYFTIKF
ncbi:unnamed protein product [Bathycoccus prasinos]